MTYWLLNLPFLVVAGMLLLLAARRISWPALGLTAAVLLVMTALFDNLMIAGGLVAYNPRAISGAFLGIAPLEDFAYAIAAVLALPALWSILPSRRRKPAPDA